MDKERSLRKFLIWTKQYKIELKLKTIFSVVSFAGFNVNAQVYRNIKERLSRLQLGNEFMRFFLNLVRLLILHIVCDDNDEKVNLVPRLLGCLGLSPSSAQLDAISKVLTFCPH